MATFLLKPFGVPLNTPGIDQIEVLLTKADPTILRICYHLPRSAFTSSTLTNVDTVNYKPQDKLYVGECIELFLSDGLRTLEYNFHPAGLYYGFATQSYRSYINHPSVNAFKPVESHYGGGEHKTYTISVDWKTASQDIWPDFKPVKILTPVISPPIPPRSGNTYWAQNHPSDKPDFHDLRYYVEL